MESIDPLPCPWCKSSDLWVHEDWDGVCIVECNQDGCEAIGPKVFTWEAKTLDERLALAIKKWNRR